MSNMFDPHSDEARVVRCKNCAHQQKSWWRDRRMKAGGYWYCGCNKVEGLGADEEFCSYGERKSAGSNTDTCVCCGEPVPEGRQVCPVCEQR